MRNELISKLSRIGFTDWFAEKIESVSLDQFQIARVTTVHKDAYTITNGDAVINAEITGKLMFTADSPLDYPVVGDWVVAQILDEDTFALVHEILPRKTTLKRKTPGKKIDYQLIAANIDTALIMQALDADFNLRRLERYLVMINEGDIEPMVILSKRDLLSKTEIQAKIDAIREMNPELLIATLSNIDDAGLDELQDLFQAGKTYCLLGSSGVGKTTLLNNLLSKEQFETHSVREKDSKGRHTTTRRQLVVLDNGALMIDTPGMRELGFVSLNSGIHETFTDIESLADECRFRDCSHTGEDGCAVIAAVEGGHLPEERYQNYLKMQKEADFHEMSYLEKRQKSKQFGKMIKNVLKSKSKK